MEQVGRPRPRLGHLVLAAALLHRRTLEQPVLPLSGLRPCEDKSSPRRCRRQPPDAKAGYETARAQPA